MQVETILKIFANKFLKEMEMNRRSATDTILGYVYQFDYIILKLLSLDNADNFITVEGIEDVDIKTIDEEIATPQAIRLNMNTILNLDLIITI